MARNLSPLWAFPAIGLVITVSFFAGYWAASRGELSLASRFDSRTQLGLPSGMAWVSNIGYYEWKHFSQHSEDGIIDYIFSSIGTTNKFYVEFGVESGDECNSRELREGRWNFTGLLMDGRFENAARNLHKEIITAGTVVSLFHKYNVPREFDFLSVDTDMYDYWLLKEVLGVFSPRVVSLEVNAKVAPGYTLTVPLNDPNKPEFWDGTDFFGASVDAFYLLAIEFGYSMVYCNRIGLNCFLVRDDIIGGSLADILKPAMLHRPPRYYHDGCGHRDDSSGRKFHILRQPMGTAHGNELDVSPRGMLPCLKYLPSQ